jgi:hypothetical protein
MDPNFYYAHGKLGKVFACKGAFDAAITQYQKARQLIADPFIVVLLALLTPVPTIRSRREDFSMNSTTSRKKNMWMPMMLSLFERALDIDQPALP